MQVLKLVDWKLLCTSNSYRGHFRIQTPLGCHPCQDFNPHNSILSFEQDNYSLEIPFQLP
jgi:hypothetical protein